MIATILLSAGLLLLLLTASIELRWRHRLQRSTFCQGTVVDVHHDGFDQHQPVVEYDLHGRIERFRSKYTIRPIMSKGDRINVLHDLGSGTAEIQVAAVRWQVTFLCGSWSMLLLILGYYIATAAAS